MFLECVEDEGSQVLDLTGHPGGGELMEDLHKTRLTGEIWEKKMLVINLSPVRSVRRVGLECFEVNSHLFEQLLLRTREVTKIIKYLTHYQHFALLL